MSGGREGADRRASGEREGKHGSRRPSMEAGDRRRAPGVWDGGRHEASGAPGRRGAGTRERVTVRLPGHIAWPSRIRVRWMKKIRLRGDSMCAVGRVDREKGEIK